MVDLIFKIAFKMPRGLKIGVKYWSKIRDEEASST